MGCGNYRTDVKMQIMISFMQIAVSQSFDSMEISISSMLQIAVTEQGQRLCSLLKNKFFQCWAQFYFN